MRELIILVFIYCLIDWLIENVSLRITGPRRSGGWRRWAFQRGRSGVCLLGLNVILKGKPHLRFQYCDVVRIQPGSTLILKTLLKPSKEEDARLRDEFFSRIPQLVDVLIVSKSAELVFVTPGSIQTSIQLDKQGTKSFLQGAEVITLADFRGRGPLPGA